MASTMMSSFQRALQTVESLPPSQQEDLIEILKHRQAEARRAELAQSIREAKADYRDGRTKKGSVADLIKDLRSCAK